ncbi:aromatic ring-hydroxylating dioxygenase subunit alpha [Aquabacter sp. L1I39]|uniref:aromatic ring-hydroxylating dioxygenase subunit alpha n=1 Tax=Aquabacter sp. L1I39 TaxID=2820278 RepID=UPI001ADA2258|nr:aromatic ring-hydroxylating dioxygenase subunit alpha [Aquabacter sp. L1I39]QTL02684.1 aromatic ring-hydroxylating dioxygenase subunit alpha [Aquabacter sp. L1I39]
MAIQKQFLSKPFAGYLNGPIPEENAELTHVEKGSPGGELLRRYWQPVALTCEVTDVPLGVRMFGEDLVVFRNTSGEYGILDRHCPHRGTSLEFGLPTECGLRCCYHGWLFGMDGKVLETPGDPPGSTLKDRLYHGAYPAREYKGLVFGYFGPVETMPDFPVYDSYEYPGDKLVPYSVSYPCNWLQVQENVMDPAHAVFLHTRVTFSHFSDTWGELPVMDFVETPTGMIYVTTRRWKDKVWVRSNDILMPNLAQVGHIWEDGQEAKQFGRVGITRWTTPIDNRTCKVIGWRHFHPEVDPRGIAREDQCGPGSVDFYGQGAGGSFEERQRLPGDYDAIVTQRPIAIHALEHLTYCDKGVVLFRKLLRRDIRRLATGEDIPLSRHRSNGLIPTYCHDTVLDLPPLEGVDDLELLEEVGRRVTEIVVEGDHHDGDDRLEAVRSKLLDYQRSLLPRAAE